MCKCILSELGEKCFTRNQEILCREDYYKKYGGQKVSGHCETCTKSIHASEHVMRAFNSVYHVNCFVCHHCRVTLRTGDKFCYHQGRIFCEKDNPNNGISPAALPPGVGMNTSPPSAQTGPGAQTGANKRANGSSGSKRTKTNTKAAQVQAAQQAAQQAQQASVANIQQHQHPHQQMLQQQQMMQQQQQQQQPPHQLQQQHQQQMSLQQQQQQHHQHHQQHHMMFQEPEQMQQQMQLQQQMIN
jgi:hypothetical protein